ncbi:hypothetical protein [Streptomyces chromofuscus]|uniref:hypothetical protein n=1 Tax=Streptomyces chromofuscus TaxID=42881 RepID=UPI0016772CD1|nr:hypothetical protein [Streptomyces chromofuscus]GGT03878.1 hypothetical protein GCM10010254_25300 [Streptomyces chromofuscus]
MLTEELLTLAAAAGAAVATAAGTDAWEELRARLGAWFGRGDSRQEEAALEELDGSAAALLEGGTPTGAELERYGAAWRDRVVATLERLDGPDREDAARDLRRLVVEDPAAPEIHGGDQNVRGDIRVHAEQGSLAAALIQGNVHFGPPPPPVRPEG